MRTVMFGPDRARGSYHRGITLLELLIVIMILLMVTAVAIPIMRPALGGRRIRESGRQLAAYLQGAKVKAAAAGRQVGIRIDRISGRRYGMDISQVEVQPSWAGDFANSRILITNVDDSATTMIDERGRGVDFPLGDSSWVGLLRKGDLIKLDYKSPLYKIKDGPTDSNGFLIAPTSSWVVTYLDDSTFDRLDAPEPWDDTNDDGNWDTGETWTEVIPPAGWDDHTGWPFQIIRQPVRSVVQPLILADGAAVDFENSGVGLSNSILATDTNPITILFSPAGYVDAVFIQGGTGMRPSGTTFLMIGQPQNVGAANLADLENIWIAITPNGTVTTEQNASGMTLAERRKFAAESQNIGGR